MGLQYSVAALTLFFVTAAAFGQAFEVESVKPSQRVVGPDKNNNLTFESTGMTARNATLRRLVAEAYGVQLNQVRGPVWLDQREYDIEAKAAGPTGKAELAVMLRGLLAERFKLTQHRETKETRVYELVVDKGGPKIHAIQDGEAPARAGGGFNFHGEMRQFADLLAVQLSIVVPDDPTRPGIAGGPSVPVLDKTGLPGIYDFGVNIKPELGSDMFTLWQRTLQDQMGLRLVNRRGNMEVIVVDSSEKIPSAN